MFDQALGDDRRREFVGVVNALATLEAQSESDRVGDVICSRRLSCPLRAKAVRRGLAPRLLCGSIAICALLYDSFLA